MIAFVAISVFGLFHPRELVVKTTDPVETHTLRVGRAGLPFTTSGEFTLIVPEKIERRFRGKLEITSKGTELLAVVHMDLETAVASVVAAEVPQGVPIEALRAQAVATRSFFLATHGRHKGFDFCDTTHCTFLREPPNPGDPAWYAAESTKGLTLQYRGHTIPALYSADCGGRTRASSPADGGGYAYVPVQCPRQTGVASRRGHGYGLCQEGATAMAASGKTYLEILSFFYPGTSVLKQQTKNSEGS